MDILKEIFYIFLSVLYISVFFLLLIEGKLDRFFMSKSKKQQKDIEEIKNILKNKK